MYKKYIVLQNEIYLYTSVFFILLQNVSSASSMEGVLSCAGSILFHCCKKVVFF